MNQNLADLNISEELFEIVFNTKDHSIPAHELCLYLSNFEKALKSINHTINREYSIGFDFVELDIIAFEKGSFSIKSLLKKYLGVELSVADVIALLTLLISLMSDDKGAVTYNINGGEIHIENGVLTKNRETIKSVRDIAGAVIENPNIIDVNFVYKNENNEVQKVSITKENLSYWANVEIKEDDQVNVHRIENVNLIIFSPVLDNEVASWKFILEGRKISAKMADIDFLEKLENHDVVFGKGDVLTVDIETRVTKKDEYSSPSVRHYVTKVHKFPSHNNRKLKQLEMFE